MKKLLAALVIALAAVLVIAAVPTFAATLPPDSDPEILSMKVYRNLRETGDWLVVIYANIPYATPPDDPVTEVYLWQLIDTDGATVLGSTVGFAYVSSGYGYNVYSLYFSADASLEWQPDPPYTLTLKGNPLAGFADPPLYNYTITNEDYTLFSLPDDVRTELAADVLAIADDLHEKWGLTDTSLVNEDETGRTLSIYGQSFFRGAIYGIQALAPALFPLAVRDITLEDRAWDEAYSAALEEQYHATWVDSARAAGAALFGTGFDMVSLIILLVGFAGVVIANICLTGDHWNGLVDGMFLMVIAAKISLYPLGYLGLINGMCYIYIGARLWGFARG
jgi:hypothetical protein